MKVDEMELERKFARLGDQLRISPEGKGDRVIEGYASVFGARDQGQDVVEVGAYATSLGKLAQSGGRVKMLWQHDPTEPIGVWDEVREDAKGLYVKGRILSDVARGREAVSLIEAGAIDGLSIGYRTVKASKGAGGVRRLTELELWEVSLVTFPMLPEARVRQKGDGPEARLIKEMASVFAEARAEMARR